MEDTKLHYIVVTGIIIKDEKFLIARRSLKEAAFPGLWTVPGGKLRTDDYTTSKKDTSDSWYNVLEKLLQREIKEEVGVNVKDIRYLLSLTYIRSDGKPTLILSFYCYYDSGSIQLSKELTEYKWVDRNGLENYALVPGLREEIEMVDDILKGGGVESWSGQYDSCDDESVRDGESKK
ncbi:NUDIX domain-containing protein [Candidatus Dojkabacteria bacterium]|nr:NUDIX domain-containing protein [Candidatus Dojkabacteria bacterium]